MRPSIQLSIGFIVLFHPLQCVVFLLGYLISRVQSHPRHHYNFWSAHPLHRRLRGATTVIHYLQTNADQKWLRSHVHSQNAFVRDFGLSL